MPSFLSALCPRTNQGFLSFCGGEKPAGWENARTDWLFANLCGGDIKSARTGYVFLKVVWRGQIKKVGIKVVREGSCATDNRKSRQSFAESNQTTPQKSL